MPMIHLHSGGESSHGRRRKILIDLHTVILTLSQSFAIEFKPLGRVIVGVECRKLCLKRMSRMIMIDREREREGDDDCARCVWGL